MLDKINSAKVHWIRDKYSLPSAMISGEPVKIRSSGSGKRAHRAIMAALHRKPSFNAIPVSVRMGEIRFCPQYWEASTTSAFPMDRANCCTIKKIWFTVAAPERAFWL